MAGHLKVPQYHFAETDKRHVTFFFNGRTEERFALEGRLMVPVAKVPRTTCQARDERRADRWPTRQARAHTMLRARRTNGQVAKGLATGKYPFVMCNFAPPTWWAPPGVYGGRHFKVRGGACTPTRFSALCRLGGGGQAVEATDAAHQDHLRRVQQHGYVLMVTADHGKRGADDQRTGGPHTAHTCNPGQSVRARSCAFFWGGEDGGADVARSAVGHDVEQAQVRACGGRQAVATWRRRLLQLMGPCRSRRR